MPSALQGWKVTKALSALQTHMLIMLWLLAAQKRKLFPRTLASDIIWLQEQGEIYGPSARLYSKVEYIWLVSSGELTQQSTLFRFTYMIDTLRTMGWKDMLLSAKEWAAGGTPAGNVCAIYTPKDELHRQGRTHQINGAAAYRRYQRYYCSSGTV